jgi:hypothetical protein
MIQFLESHKEICGHLIQDVEESIHEVFSQFISWFEKLLSNLFEKKL